MLLDHLTSAQLSEWEAYDRLDPVGTWREDFRMANIICYIVNTARSIHGKKGIKMTTPIDFMPQWDEEGERDTVKTQSVEEMKQILLGLGKMKFKKIESREELTNKKK